jgi:hypothetical protein
MGLMGLAMGVLMWIGYAGLVVAAVSWLRRRAD